MRLSFLKSKIALLVRYLGAKQDKTSQHLILDSVQGNVRKNNYLLILDDHNVLIIV